MNDPFITEVQDFLTASRWDYKKLFRAANVDPRRWNHWQKGGERQREKQAAVQAVMDDVRAKLCNTSTKGEGSCK